MNNRNNQATYGSKSHRKIYLGSQCSRKGEAWTFLVRTQRAVAGQLSL